MAHKGSYGGKAPTRVQKSKAVAKHKNKGKK